MKRTAKNPKHPMQPIELAPDGIIRFKENTIVRWMLDAGRRGDRYDLNTLATIPFPTEDRIQLMQLIGYSVSGFGELSFVPRVVIEAADKAAEAIR